MQLWQDGLVALLAAIGLASLMWMAVRAVLFARPARRESAVALIPAQGDGEHLEEQVHALTLMSAEQGIIGAILLVVYRDKVNLDALKRYITYRNLEKNDAGQTTEFTYTRDASNVFASLDGTLLLCSDTALQLYSNSGLLYIDEQVKMSQPVICHLRLLRCGL